MRELLCILAIVRILVAKMKSGSSANVWLLDVDLEAKILSSSSLAEGSSCLEALASARREAPP